jgi:nickel/cobalt transporter (NicO) family protein
MSLARRGVTRIALVASTVTFALFTLVAPARPASAHPVDEYLQSSYITVTPTTIDIELDLSPGVLVAPVVLRQLDADANSTITDPETRAYVDTVMSTLVLDVDGTSRPFAITRIESPEFLTVQAGYGIIKVFASAAVDNAIGPHQLRFRNGFAPPRATYQVNTFVTDAAAVSVGAQVRDDRQQQLDVTYTVTAVGGAVSASSSSVPNVVVVPSTTRSTKVGRLADFLGSKSSSLPTVLLTFAVAMLLGALHALTPGHGKTLVAAYLVGDRGTARHAVALGAIVTFTHTISVVVIGLLALFASHFIVPTAIAPTVGVISGLLVVVLGIRLFVQRLRAFRRDPASLHDHDHHDHNHDCDHDHAPVLVNAAASALRGSNDRVVVTNSVASRSTDHDSHTHDHGDGRVHSHLLPSEAITIGNLVAMGVSGGMVPCPEALGIMVIAVGLNRIAMGLGLIVSFSFGLAAILIGIGLLLVKSRSVIERFFKLGGRWGRLLPLISAAVVTVLGLAIAMKSARFGG